VHAIIVEALKNCGALPDAEWLRHMGRDDDSRWCLIVCRDGDLVLSPGPNADRVGSVIRLGDEDSVESISLNCRACWMNGGRRQ
jgi:hypothetical protein